MDDTIRTAQEGQGVALEAREVPDKRVHGADRSEGLPVNDAQAGQGGVSGKTPLAGGSCERQQARKRSGSKAKKLSVFKAVRAKCIDCAGGSWKYVKFCPSDGVHSLRCPLWPFRFGIRPETARKRYGPDFLDPAAMPDASTNLDDLP